MARSTRHERGRDELGLALQARLGRLLPIVLRASLFIGVATSAFAWMNRHTRPVSWWTYEATLTVTLAAMGLHHFGRTRAAGVVLSLGFFAMAVAGVLLLGGPSSPACFLLVPVTLTAALFWGWWSGAVLAVLSVLLVIISAPLLTAGLLPMPPVMPARGLAGVVSGALAITAVLIGTALRSLREAVADSNWRAREMLGLFRENPDGIVVLDDTGIIRDINPAALDLARLGEGDVIGRHFAALPVFSARDARLAIRRFSALARGARRTFALRLTRDDGSVFWGDARSRVVVADDGSERVQVTIRDVTQRKLAEQRHAELEGHLLRLQRFENIGRVSGAVAHDVNNLLTVVGLVASTLRSRLDPDARELADDLCDSATRAAKLNRRLLAVGRTEMTQREAVDLNVTIEGMRRLLERMIEAPRKLVVHLDPAPCVVLADGAQLEQIIINLVTNGRDAIHDDGRLTIETERFDESVVVRVSDTGIGMDTDTQHRIFEPFFTTKGSAGTGLGLATVREIVKSIGGRIDVDSQPGQGTRFEVLLPALPGAAVDR